MSTELAKRGQDTPISSLQKLLKANEGQLKMALPDHLRSRPDRFIRLATTALITTPSLQNCSMLSIANSVMLAAQLGLEPNNGLGHGWLISYAKVCTFQPGYRGLLDLGYRANAFRSAQPQIVYTGDEWDYREGAEPRLDHVPCPPSRRRLLDKEDPESWDWIGAYSRVKLPDNGIDALWMWKEEIEAVRDKSSKAANRDDSPWKRWAWEMIKKTPVKRHMKFLRLSPEAALAVGADDQAEAFADRDRDKIRRNTLAQDVMLTEEMREQAEEIDYTLNPPREEAVQAQNEIRERKTRRRDPAPQEPPPDASSLADLLSMVKSPADAVQAFGDMHKTVSQTFAEDGQERYERIMGEHGFAASPKVTAGDMERAHKAIAALFAEIRGAK